MSRVLSVLFLAGLISGTAQAQGPVFNGVGAGNLIDFTTWNLYGSASASNSTPGNGFTYSNLSLTSPGTGGQGGAAFAPSTVNLDFNQAFTITFDFFISPGTVTAGDGMTFVLTPDNPDTVNGGNPLEPSGGSDLGYGNSGLSGLAFAIDTFNFVGEPIAPSIQILENGSVTPLASTETGLTDIRDPSYFQWGTTLSYTPSGLDDFTGTLTGTIDQFIGGLSFSVSATVDGSSLDNTPLYLLWFYGRQRPGRRRASCFKRYSRPRTRNLRHVAGGSGADRLAHSRVAWMSVLLGAESVNEGAFS